MQLASESTPVTNRAMRRKVTQPLEAINHPGAHLRSDVVLALVGVSRSQWYRMVADGTAPPPLKWGTRCTRWLASDISKFLADRAVQGVQK